MKVDVLHVCDFAAPYPGAFIRQLRMLDDVLVAEDGSGAHGERRIALAFPARAKGQPWLDDLDRDGFQVFLLNEPTPLPRKATVEQLRALIEELNCGVVHSHFAGYDQSVAAAVGGTAKSRRPIQIWHYRTSLECPVNERTFVRRCKDMVKYRWYGRSVDRCVGVTEAMAQEVAQRGMRDRAVAVVAGCDTDTFQPSPRNRRAIRGDLGINSTDVFILHMGWSWQRKGGDVLAQAMRILDQRGYANLIVRSIGAAESEVEAPVETLPPRSAVQELHQASDIFVSASRSEGFGNGLIEAMACERVAVASSTSGQRELFSGLDGCRSVAVGNAEELADGLQWLLDNREQWRELGASNRQRIVERYSMRRWAGQMVRLYQELSGIGGSRMLRESQTSSEGEAA